MDCVLYEFIQKASLISDKITLTHLFVNFVFTEDDLCCFLAVTEGWDYLLDKLQVGVILQQDHYDLYGFVLNLWSLYGNRRNDVSSVMIMSQFHTVVSKKFQAMRYHPRSYQCLVGHLLISQFYCGCFVLMALLATTTVAAAAAAIVAT